MASHERILKTLAEESRWLTFDELYHRVRPNYNWIEFAELLETLLLRFTGTKVEPTPVIAERAAEAARSLQFLPLRQHFRELLNRRDGRKQMLRRAFPRLHRAVHAPDVPVDNLDALREA